MTSGTLKATPRVALTPLRARLLLACPAGRERGKTLAEIVGTAELRMSDATRVAFAGLIDGGLVIDEGELWRSTPRGAALRHAARRNLRRAANAQAA